MNRVHHMWHIVSGIFFETLFGLVLVAWAGILCLAATLLYR